MEERVRAPVVAGQFYPHTARALSDALALLVDTKAKKSDCLGCIMPHAGYMYSGPVAGATVSRVTMKDTVILLGPNHTGDGEPFSIMTEGVWETPLGRVPIDTELATALLAQSKYLKKDIFAHQGEHSLEVELPFLQYWQKPFKIVPIAFMSDDLESLQAVGESIGAVVKQTGLENRVLFVASSDMTHYEPEASAKRQDQAAIDAIVKLDESELMERIRRLNITMCGYAPVCVLLRIAKVLGAKKASLVKYQTSGDATGDRSSVVGYAGFTIP